ncbi:MAG: tRNA (adenosine(37)-N6)-dimethylallyltransferase MiaA [Lachnospiraceae bacterium]|nr:tRNA (adenosine(37)-N6)-dimethylallyltransferase MiaA [Lachnospiraceae bacterium]
MKKPLVILAGPTATGKTKYSVMFAKRHEGSVISADSMQVYKYMDIGSAKISRSEMEDIPHYLVDVLEPSAEFHVASFCEMAKNAINDIYAHKRLPLLVGGTGFYIRAFLYGADFSKGDENPALREELEGFVREKGAHALHERLRAIDAISAERIHENNIKRVIRAIEFYEETGTPISAHNDREAEKDSEFAFCYFVLTDDRDKLYAAIDRRVDRMMEEGLLEEVKALYEMGYNRDYVSMQGLGYKELLDVLEGKDSLDHAIYTIKRDTRHFAKRQLTWFKREKEVVWIHKKDFHYDNEAILRFMEDECKKRELI